MLLRLFSFERWIRRQSEEKREEVEDQLSRGGKPVWIEETQSYIVVFSEEDEADQQDR